MTQPKVIWEKRTSIKKKASIRSGSLQFCRAFILMTDRGGPNPLWVGTFLGSWSWILYESRLSFVKPGRASQSMSLLQGLWISYCLPVPFRFEFLPWLPSVNCDGGYETNKPFHPRVSFSHGVSSQQENH